MGEGNVKKDNLPFLFVSAEVDVENSEGVIASKTDNKETNNFEKYFSKNFATYLAAIGYSYFETAKASPELFNPNFIEPVHRATVGIRSLFDQNIGDGTIMAISFVGADVFFQSVEIIAKKFGAKEFDSTLRFLTSISIGVLVSGWLETTTKMGNVVDIPGDWFGVGLGALSILSMRWLQENATHKNIEQLFLSKQTKEDDKTLLQLDKIVDTNLNRQETSEDVNSAAQALAQRLVSNLDVQDNK